MNGLKLLSSGMLSLIQDLGRTGVAHLGLSVGGPVDLHAHCWANRLVGNSSDTATVEITMGNIAFEALSDVTMSLTGAAFPVTINGSPIDSWRSFILHEGDVLSIGYAKSGFRGYLAVAGGFDVPEVFGSAATVMRNSIGGLKSRPGKALQKGNVLPVAHVVREEVRQAEPHWTPRNFVPRYSDRLSIGVIESYQADQFPAQAKQMFYSEPYLITDKLDRMGIRLEGNAVDCGMSGIISEGIALGAIQFPANGQPIILLNDRQTLGGYPKLGCVSRMSLMKLAQARPGSKLNFYRADIEREVKDYCEFLRFFEL